MAKPSTICLVKVGSFAVPITQYKDGRYYAAVSLPSRERPRKVTSVDLDVVKDEVERLLLGLMQDGDAETLSGREARIYLAAKEAIKDTGREVDHVCREFAAAHLLLRTGVSIRDAIVFFNSSHKHAELTAGVFLADVVKELLEAIKGRSRPDRMRYHEDMNTRLGSLTRYFPERKIDELQTPDFERWLTTFNHLSARSVNKYRDAAVTLLNFAAGRNKHHRPAGRYVARDHAAVDLPKVEDRGGRREYFTAREVAALLMTAPDKLQPVFALGALAGLRQSEILRLEWTDIDFDAGVINLDRFQAKTYGERHVKIGEALSTWLEPFRDREGRVTDYKSPNSLARAMSRVATKVTRIVNDKPVEGMPWKNNGLRHGYATHRIPMVDGGYAQVAMEMGTSERKLLQNYRKPITKERAEPYWNIRRPDHSIIEFDFAKASAVV